MKPKWFIFMLVTVIMALSLPALAVEEHSTEHTSVHQEHQEHVTGREEGAEAPHTHEEQAKHDEPAAHEKHAVHEEHIEDKGHGEHKEHAKHAEAEHADKHEAHGEHGGHKEYPKLAKGTRKIAYIAIGFISFVLIAVPIGAYLEKKKHPHASHH